MRYNQISVYSGRKRSPKPRPKPPPSAASPKPHRNTCPPHNTTQACTSKTAPTTTAKPPVPPQTSWFPPVAPPHYAVNSRGLLSTLSRSDLPMCRARWNPRYRVSTPSRRSTGGATVAVRLEGGDVLLHEQVIFMDVVGTPGLHGHVVTYCPRRHRILLHILPQFRHCSFKRQTLFSRFSAEGLLHVPTTFTNVKRSVFHVLRLASVAV